jgi:hypothetical protein
MYEEFIKNANFQNRLLKRLDHAIHRHAELTQYAENKIELVLAHVFLNISAIRMKDVDLNAL